MWLEKIARDIVSEVSPPTSPGQICSYWPGGYRPKETYGYYTYQKEGWDVMNLQQLASLFVVGIDSETCGNFQIRSLAPEVTILENINDGHIQMLRCKHAGRIYIYLHAYAKFDNDRGAYFSGTKTSEIAKVVKNLAPSFKDMSLHHWRCHSSETPSVDDWLDTLSFEGHLHVHKYLDTFEREQAKLERDLIGFFGDTRLLKDDNGKRIIASPIKPCACCNRFKKVHEIAPVTQPVLDEKGFIVEDDKGDPIIKGQDVCPQCRTKFRNDVQLDSFHVFNRPISKSETTFKVWPFDRTAGVELETVRLAPVDDKAIRNLGWKLVPDGSIRIESFPNSRGVEYNSPAACGDAFFERITKGMSLWARNSRVNASCGFHVHVGIDDLDPVQKASVQNFLIAMEELLFALQPASRQKNDYCRRWGVNAVISQPDRILTSEKYMGVNFSHVNPAPLNISNDRRGDGGYGTIEFRMGGGTRNASKVLKWVEVCLRLVEIGSTQISKDNYLELRRKDLGYKFALFEKLSKSCDEESERPEKFLTELVSWMKERMERFNREIKEQRIEIPVIKNTKRSFKDAESLPVEDVQEVYEERQGFA